MNLAMPGVRRFAQYSRSFFMLLALLMVVYVSLMIFMVKPEMNFSSKPQKQYNYIMLPLLIHRLDDDSKSNKTRLLTLLSAAHIRFDDQVIKVSISKHPKWQALSKAHLLNKYLETTKFYPEQKLQLSYQLRSGMWLNYSEKIVDPSYVRSTLFFFIGTICLGLIIFYGWTILAFKVPLKQLQSSARQLGIDINTKPQLIHGPSVVKETSTMLNVMQTRIKELINNRMQLLASISHDIRTPITRLRLKAHLIEDKAAARKIEADLDEIEAMLTSILDFGKNDGLREKKTAFDICSLLFTIGYDFTDMGHEVTLMSDVRYEPFTGRRNAVKRCFTNLIQNAIKYAGRVWIDFSVQEQQVIVTISDDGPGIAENELPYIFKPFYRTQAGKKTSSTGSGLGLSIVKEIVETHAGEIRVQNKPQGGLQVTVILPRNVEQG